MNEVTIARLFQAFLAPAIVISATGLLILSINVRLMGMVSRLRHFVHARYDATRGGRALEAEAYNTQIESIEKRAETMRRCFLFSLISLAATITSCLLLGLGIYSVQVARASVIVFVAALICLLVGVLYYIREVMDALSSVRDEQRDLKFMDLGAHRETPHRESLRDPL